MPNALLPTLSLLAALQKERGIALVEYALTDASDILPFEDQALLTHKELVLAQKNNLDFWVLLPERFFESFAERNNATFRKELSHDALIEWYLFNLEQPIYQLALGHLANHAGFSPSQTSAFIHFLASLRYLSQLRDSGLSIYHKAEILPVDVNRMKNMALSCLSRERLFMGLADEKLRLWMDEARAPSAATIGKMDQVLRKIRDGYSKGVVAENPMSAWLSLFNDEIAQRYESFMMTLSRLTNENKGGDTGYNRGVSLESDIEQQWDVIQAHPLFRGLSEVALRNVLKGAKLIDVDKNTVLFAQGDPISRFIIVLEGWARSYKTSADGQESVLQILGRKDCMMDHALMTASLAPFTLKTFTKGRILSLSLSTLTDHLSRNRELSQNLLLASTTRLQRLVSHFEQITLRTAEQRVGWFLVNLYLETGLEGEPLKLPFDKALIASYLNIKPETFSRVLKQFKQRGFLIDKHQITMPESHALCEYCDPDMALRCCRAEAANCAPIQAARRARGEV
ncbi:MAG: Crp/Fnr family transcriptional regulator [Bdellovibrionales bacterium]